jgi:hypothetical protein
MYVPDKVKIKEFLRKQELEDKKKQEENNNNAPEEA